MSSPATLLASILATVGGVIALLTIDSTTGDVLAVLVLAIGLAIATGVALSLVDDDS